MKKRIASILLAVCFCSLLPSVAYAQVTIIDGEGIDNDNSYAYNPFYVSDDAQELIDYIEETLPETPIITRADVHTLINEGGLEGQQALNEALDAIYTEPVVDVTAQSRSSGVRFSAAIDAGTGETVSVYDDFDEASGKRASNGSLVEAPYLDAFEQALEEPQNPPSLRNSFFYESQPWNNQSYWPVCKVIAYNPDDEVVGVGSGYVIGNKAVATAGHIVANTDYGPNLWARNLDVWPAVGINDASYVFMPFGSYRADYYKLTCGGNWYYNQDHTDDWGIITLTEEISSGAYYNFTSHGATPTDWDIVGMDWRVQGYAGGEYILKITNGTVVLAGARLMTVNTTHTTKGMSGGPSLYANYWCAGHHVGSDDSGRAVLLRIDDWIFNKYMEYRSL